MDLKGEIENSHYNLEIADTRRYSSALRDTGRPLSWTKGFVLRLRLRLKNSHLQPTGRARGRQCHRQFIGRIRALAAAVPRLPATAAGEMELPLMENSARDRTSGAVEGGCDGPEKRHSESARRRSRPFPFLPRWSL